VEAPAFMAGVQLTFIKRICFVCILKRSAEGAVPLELLVFQSSLFVVFGISSKVLRLLRLLRVSKVLSDCRINLP